MRDQIIKPEGSYISFFSNLVKENGGINLAQGIPGFQPPSDLLQSLQKILNGNVHQYAPGTGNFKLLDLLYLHYNKSFPVKKDNFLVLQGATEALSLTYTYLNQILKENFSALSFEPAYESYSNLPKIFRKDYIDFPLEDHQSVDFDKLKSTISKYNVKIVFVSSPGNPFGKIWKFEEIYELNKLATDFDFYLIFDAVYKDLYFETPPYIPLEFDSKRLFYVNSFSKSLCITGWRVGYLYAHETHIRPIRAIHDYIGLCAPSLLQEALANYLSASDFGEDFTPIFRKSIHQNFSVFSKSLQNLGFYIPPIEGGCFIWARLPNGYESGFKFALELYQKTGVAIIPGEHFSGNHKNWVRINIARPFEEINRGSELISQFLSK